MDIITKQTSSENGSYLQQSRTNNMQLLISSKEQHKNKTLKGIPYILTNEGSWDRE